MNNYGNWFLELTIIQMHQNSFDYLLENIQIPCEVNIIITLQIKIGFSAKGRNIFVWHAD